MKSTIAILALALVTVLTLAMAHHTFIIQQLCWNGIIEDSTAESVGAFLDGKL